MYPSSPRLSGTTTKANGRRPQTASTARGMNHDQARRLEPSMRFPGLPMTLKRGITKCLVPGFQAHQMPTLYRTATNQPSPQIHKVGDVYIMATGEAPAPSV